MFNYILFFRETEENGWLSNWYYSPFEIDGFWYLHVEQYIMAQKAKFFHDSVSYTSILRATTPKECKALGRDVKPYDDAEWAKVRYDVLKTGVKAKFTQNILLKNALIATGDKLLAEVNPNDDVFGIGLSSANAMKVTPDQWKGQNLLGKALMEVRSEIC